MASTLYFAYLSNMSPKRMLQSCPNAKMKCVGKVQNHKLVFIGYKEEWKGACGNLVSAQGRDVWGVIWEVNQSDMPGLQGTEKGGNIEFTVPMFDIISQDGEVLKCLLFKRESCDADIGLPSPQYLQVGIEGAVKNKLPQEYIDFLKSVPTNDNTVYTDGMKNALY